jgi:hypothetical protein
MISIAYKKISLATRKALDFFEDDQKKRRKA